MSNADTFYFFFLLGLCYILNYSFIAIFAVVNYYSSFLWLVLLYSKRVQCRKRICFVLNWFFFSPNVFFVLLPRTYWYVEPKEEKKKLETHKNCIDLIWVNVVAVCTVLYIVRVPQSYLAHAPHQPMIVYAYIYII